MLYDNGSTGINVEANPELLAEFNRARPRDTNVNVGIGCEGGTQPFYIFRDSPALSTFSEDQVTRLQGMGKELERQIDIEVVTFDELMACHSNSTCPDFLTIDVEGHDLQILRSIDFDKYRPKVIIAELNSHHELLRFHDIDLLLFRNHYFHFGDVGGGIEGRNGIFVDREHTKCLLASCLSGTLPGGLS